MGIELTGIIIGAATFLTIGAFHPLVIKAEYYLGRRCWWLFLLLGLGCLAGSLFSMRQHRRVEKGWFPKGPGHHPKKG